MIAATNVAEISQRFFHLFHILWERQILQATSTRRPYKIVLLVIDKMVISLQQFSQMWQHPYGVLQMTIDMLPLYRIKENEFVATSATIMSAAHHIKVDRNSSTNHIEDLKGFFSGCDHSQTPYVLSK